MWELNAPDYELLRFVTFTKPQFSTVWPNATRVTPFLFKSDVATITKYKHLRCVSVYIFQDLRSDIISPFPKVLETCATHQDVLIKALPEAFNVTSRVTITKCGISVISRK